MSLTWSSTVIVFEVPSRGGGVDLIVEKLERLNSKKINKKGGGGGRWLSVGRYEV